MERRDRGRFIRGLVAVGDFCCINLVFLMVYLFFDSDMTHQFNQKIVWLLLNISYFPVVLMFNQIHNTRIIYIDSLLLAASESVVLLFLIFILLLTFLQIEVGTIVLLTFFVGFFISLNLWWLLASRVLKYYRSKGFNFKRIIIVGAGKTGLMLFRELHSDLGYGYKFLGFFDDNAELKGQIPQLLGDIGMVEKFALENNVDEIYCALPGSQDAKILNLLQFSERHAIRFFIVPEISRYVLRRLHFQIMGRVPVLSVREEPLQRWEMRAVKRFFDFVFSSVILLLSPLWLLPIAICVKLSSPGPVLFKQKRTGFMGREFNCLKFRTMRVNNECDKLQATKGDPRITRIGEFLRKTSLDELPQFINVFKGEMSVVGPRPHMLKHTKDYSAIIDKYMVRHFIKPGLTGWAQVNGYRGETKELWQMEKRVEYDVWYIENWNFMLDMKIIFLTLIGIFKGDKNAF